MFSRSLLSCAMCVVALACDRTEKTRFAMESRMDADTVARTVDSTGIGESGAGSLVAEPPMADTAGKIASGALSDLSISGSVDTAAGSRPRPIPAEPPPKAGSTPGARRLP
jgi:hypothetical protein